MKNKREISERKRNNARLYPLYKMVSWDRICFYSIEFLFYTITKNVTASEVLIINAIYIISRILMQIPAVTISDILGKRTGIIIGNIFVMINILVLMLAPGMIGIIIANLFFALGYDIKIITETNLLYDSVSTRGGEGLYTKLDSKGGSWYYWLDGITCLSSGYLFVINNYLPLIICLGFALIATILSFGFKDVYKTNKDNKKSIGTILNEYGDDLSQSFKFIIKSRRIKAYVIFGAIFYGIICTFDVYRCDLLTFKGIPEEQYSMIFAVLTLIAGIGVSLSENLHKKFKNKTLTVLSGTYILGCVIIGICSNTLKNEISIPIIILLLAILKICTSIWYILEYKYLKNFTTPEIRNKIMFTYELIGGIVASTIAFIGSLVLKMLNIDRAFLLESIASAIVIIIVLIYMKPRFGLKPKDYKKEDIEMKERVKSK